MEANKPYLELAREVEDLKQQLANVSAELQVMTRWHRYVRAKLDEVAPEAWKTIANYFPDGLEETYGYRTK